VAEPKVLGILRRSLTPKLRRVVEHEIAHYLEGTDEELEHRVFEAIHRAQSRSA
jgi:protein required for attachment to host cells